MPDLNAPRPYDIRKRKLVHAADDTVTELFYGSEVIRGWLSVPCQADVDDAIAMHKAPKLTEQEVKDRLRASYEKATGRKSA